MEEIDGRGRRRRGTASTLGPAPAGLCSGEKADPRGLHPERQGLPRLVDKSIEAESACRGRRSGGRGDSLVETRGVRGRDKDGGGGGGEEGRGAGVSPLPDRRGGCGRHPKWDRLSLAERGAQSTSLQQNEDHARRLASVAGPRATGQTKQRVACCVVVVVHVVYCLVRPRNTIFYSQDVQANIR